MAARGAHRRNRESGQATVELVAVLPAALVLALLAWQLALAGHAAWLAGSSARVGARAAAVGGDPAAAARTALPEGLRRHLRVRRRGDRVTVALHPPLVLPRWTFPLEVNGSASLPRQTP